MLLNRTAATDVATQNLNVDWRLGAAYFEEALIDHDVTANWGNWMFAAGLSGGRVNKFNVLKQARQYDPEGEFVRTWIPELARVPTERVHTPWLLSAAEARACGADAYFDSTHDLVAQQLPFYFGAMSAARKELVSQLADLEVQNSEVEQRQQQQRRCG